MTERKFTHPNDAPEGHKWQTKSGSEFRLYNADAGGDEPIHGAWSRDGIDWSQGSWTATGLFQSHTPGSLDLADVLVERTIWLNAYPFDTATYDTREEADDGAGSSRVARLKITYPEGQFDE